MGRDKERGSHPWKKQSSLNNLIAATFRTVPLPPAVFAFFSPMETVNVHDNNAK